MQTHNLVTIVIPVYNPDEKFTALLHALIANGYKNVIIINDGSQKSANPFFQEAEKFCYTVLTHSINLGQGRAYKTGFNYYLSLPLDDSIGIIECDCDGQHSIADINKCAELLCNNPDKFILGVRNFSSSVPFRSRFGNTVTSFIFKTMFNLDVKDTQTGLKGIPKKLIPMLMEVSGERFEYASSVLLAMKRQDVEILQFSIETIYIEGNKMSHFRPLRDSLRIYSLILRYLASSILAVMIDFIVFSLTNIHGCSVWASTALGRTFAALFNFFLNRNAVFKAKSGSIYKQSLKYVCLLSVSGSISAASISVAQRLFSTGTVFLKMIVEACLFFFNYYIQRIFVFANATQAKSTEKNTDWTAYYSGKKSWFSTFTQRFTLSRILKAIGKYPSPPQTQTTQTNQEIRAIHATQTIPNSFSICELGGGNSCFCEQLCRAVTNITRYDIIDNNPLAVEMFETLSVPVPHKGFCCDLLIQSSASEIQASEVQQLLKSQGYQEYQGYQDYDFVFSIGLIEHFRGKDIQTLIKRHFEFCKDGGLVLISFPTPTKKYRFVRRCMELIGCWQFHDEKPIRYSEVEKYFKKYGTVLEHYINYKLPLTQEIVIVRKNDQN